MQSLKCWYAILWVIPGQIGLGSFPFKSSLELYQLALPTPVQKYFKPSEKGASH